MCILQVVDTAVATASKQCAALPCDSLSALNVHDKCGDEDDETSDGEESYDVSVGVRVYTSTIAQLSNEPPIELIMSDSKKPRKSCMTLVEGEGAAADSLPQPKLLQFRENISFIE